MHYVEQLSKNLSKENIWYIDNLLFLTGILKNNYVLNRVKKIKRFIKKGAKNQSR